jgi:4-amino-4-deoxy-L-arabinose transferase-like glycosyltransferase
MPVITKRIELFLLVFILLLAALFRLWQLDSIPPGLTHDEADTGYYVTAVYRGSPSQVETPYGYANEPFSMYSGALFMALFGPNYVALRVHSAFWGLTLLVFAYLWSRRAFGVPVALAGAAIVATSYWAISNSRFALNSEPAPALFAGAVFFLWVALYHRDDSSERWWAWGLFALFLAGSLYAYEAARAVVVAIVAFFLYLALFDRPRCRRHALWFVGALALVALLAVPHLLDPDAWQRSSTLSGPLEAAKDGDFGPLLSNARSALGTFNFSGDSFVTYNLPGRPIFDPILSLFFFVGTGWCVWHWRQPACALMLLWVAAGVAPSLIIGEWTSTLHSKGAEASILLLPAVGAVAVGNFINKRLGLRWTGVFIVAGLVWLTVAAAFTWRDYFVRWGQAPETRAAYFHNLAAVTDYVDRLPADSVVALSSPFPDLPLDPFIAAMRVRRDDLIVRWFDGRRALLFPPAEQSYMILPSNTPLDPDLAGWVPVSSAERVIVHPEDADPHFDVLHLHPQENWSVITTQLSGETVQGGGFLSLPVNFGDALELVGYQLETPSVVASEPVTLMTAWRVINPEALGPLPPQRYSRAAAIFVHMLDPSGKIVGQEDRLDVPAWNWQPGDRFVQLHRFVPDAVLRPGDYLLEIGVYTRPDLLRLPVLSEDGLAGDQVYLQTVEVRAP